METAFAPVAQEKTMRKKTRKLSLSRETLRSLAAYDVELAAGGTGGTQSLLRLCTQTTCQSDCTACTICR